MRVVPCDQRARDREKFFKNDSILCTCFNVFSIGYRVTKKCLLKSGYIGRGVFGGSQRQEGFSSMRGPKIRVSN